LECTSSGGPNNTYQWLANGIDLTGETSGNLTLPNVTAATGGIYTCMVSNIAGSHNTSTFVYIYPYFVNQPLDFQVSMGSTLEVVCDTKAFPEPEYLWHRVDGMDIRSEIETNQRNLTISSVEFNDNGDYYCNASGIVQSQSFLITGR
jgi:hypothetical protein